ncbi:MAG: MFS transporter [Lachnospiraceae bacterium]|nr:MFS transporter [Lachnospiraceae bacterium]
MKTKEINQIKRLKYACYTSNLSLAIVANLSPLLFLTFRSLYGISYTLLGLLVLINFVTQLTVDLIFSFFSYKFQISKTVRCMPLFTVTGLVIYALWPFFSPGTAYIGLVIGTVIFSAGAGLVEVLISPVISSLPAKDPDREMSKLHSVYAWGVVAMIIISTLFLQLKGAGHWHWLALLFMLVPLVSICLFAGTQIPQMETPKKISGTLHLLKNKGIWLCVAAIFLGGAAECNMAQWSSGYLEQALQIPKVWGDVFGVALFSAMLGLGRTLYAKIGKNIERVLFFGAVGAVVCYLTAAVTDNAVAGLAACAFTGFCTSMLWPGNLIVASERFPTGGVFIYALMAAGGDLGASVAPQMVGIVADTVVGSRVASEAALSMGLLPEQLGMKLGLLTGMLFPLAAIPVFFWMWRKKK